MCSNLQTDMEKCFSRILELVEKFESVGSGWIFRFWKSITLKIIKPPIMEQKGAAYIPTPIPLRKKRCLLNIKNNDDLCFLYCVIASKHQPKYNRTRPTFYKPYLTSLKMTGNLQWNSLEYFLFAF